MSTAESVTSSMPSFGGHVACGAAATSAAGSPTGCSAVFVVAACCSLRCFALSRRRRASEARFGLAGSTVVSATGSAGRGAASDCCDFVIRRVSSS